MMFLGLFFVCFVCVCFVFVFVCVHLFVLFFRKAGKKNNDWVKVVDYIFLQRHGQYKKVV